MAWTTLECYHLMYAQHDYHASRQTSQQSPREGNHLAGQKPADEPARIPASHGTENRPRNEGRRPYQLAALAVLFLIRLGPGRTRGFFA